ncbi:MAG TPA: dihydrolipoyl dehydrogenase [Nitrospiraceae bacterium]|nr:dihydrolipoyl dehydrogenase [Nitrospiraceae bacterium]
MAKQDYDLIVIGGGPGGYLAAIRAAQLGMKVVCVDEREQLGGTCLNIGCIPSKALLNSTHKFREAQHSLKDYGVLCEGVALDLAAMMEQKAKAVRTLTSGVAHLFRKHKIDHARGRGRLLDRQQVEVRPLEGSPLVLQAPAIILATGSAPASLPGLEIDEERIMTSTGALSLKEVPEHLVVVGGGYIGLELGSVWGRLGAKVTCVEMLDRLAPGTDGEVAQLLQKVLEQQGFSFRLRTGVKAARVTKKGVALALEPAEGGKGESLSCSHVLVAVGRRPYTQGLGLDKAGVALDDRGFIKIDREFRTSAEGIFAIGDVVRQPMLAHKAYDEATACVEIIAGRRGYVHYESIPAIIYTWPEVAGVGRTEEELKQQGRPYRVGRFPFRANSRARCTGELDGFVKILADAQSDLILGAHLIGPDAGTMIHEIVAAMKFGATAEELGRMAHAHPTLSEAVREAALAVHGRAYHI